jgi:cobalt-zinc-cadmium efflux system membrane fusion protein
MGRLLWHNAHFPFVLVVLTVLLTSTLEIRAAGGDEGADGRNAGAGKHVGNDAHGEESSVHLTKTEIEEFGIRLLEVVGGLVGPSVELSGEIVVNPDRFAHVVPRVGGVVRNVQVGLGDSVRAGDVMAVIDSRELSDLKSAYLATVNRKELAEASFAREERLWKQNISSERDYLAAKQALAETGIAARSAEHKLQALGFSKSYLDELPGLPDILFTQFEIRAPFDGIVVSKHITLGESVAEDAEVFSVTDLSRVWAILTVYQKELGWIQKGMRVSVHDLEGGAERVWSEISYVSPILDESTRTASARAVVENGTGIWRPGMFVKANVTKEGRSVPVAVPIEAIQKYEGRQIVFVYSGDEFALREVVTGESTEGLVEIVSGLNPGETIASSGAFTLKTQIQKSEFESGHNH